MNLFKFFLFCFVTCFLISCGDKDKPPKPLDPNKKAEDQKRLEDALKLEQELRKKAQQADIDGTATPVGDSALVTNSPSPIPPATPPTVPPTTAPLPQTRPLPPTPVTPVCDRTRIIQQAILKKSGKTNCKNVTVEDLQAIVALILGSSHPMSTYPAIFSLKSGDFSGLTSLKILNLAGNELRTLPPGIFNGLISLEVLSLEDNSSLKNLTPEIFNGLVSLKELHLGGCCVESLPPNVFSTLAVLEYLNLGQMHSGCDPSSSSLYLSAEMFDKLNSLKTLILQDDFTIIPNGIFKNLSALKRLTIIGCFQALHPTTFIGLNSLEYLHIGTTYSNDLPTLPQRIFSHLNLLKTLSLSNNGLESLPPLIFQGLSLLESLEFYGNKLTLLPEQLFRGLVSLKRLSLSKNDIQNLPPLIFKDLSSLETLALRWNKNLSSFPPGALEYFPFLRVLDIGVTDINAGELARIRRELKYVSNPDCKILTTYRDMACKITSP